MDKTKATQNRLRLLRSLRCPNCLSGEVAVESQPDGALSETVSAACRTCGRVLSFSKGVLCALPDHLDNSDAVNARYYGEMSSGDESHLERRSKTRNHRTKMDLVAKHLALGERQPPRFILELGFGAGAHAAAVLMAGHVYTGLDVSAALLVQARRSLPILETGLFVNATGTRIPFQDAVFDAVFCVGTLHHLEEPNAGVDELIRVLAPGGRFCFLEPRWLYPAHLMGYLANRSVEIGSLRTTPKRILNCLRQHGVRHSQIEYAIYTPNQPTTLVPLYEAIDRFCQRFEILRLLSVMFCVYGTK